jgi:hypothetical protein
MKADFSLATLGKDPHLMFYFVMVANRSFKTSYLKLFFMNVLLISTFACVIRMADLIAREFEAIFRCYNELLKNDSNDSAASVNRAALIFQLKLIFTVSCLLPTGTFF